MQTFAPPMTDLPELTPIDYLCCRFIHQELDEPEWHELERALQHSSDARRRFSGHLRLHVDLHLLFAANNRSPTLAR